MYQKQKYVTRLVSCYCAGGGFTLIELLVVVLIIGILSAVALPQYTTAVEKSRLASMMSNVKTLADAAELHWLATGGYEDDTTNLDVSDIGGCMQKGVGQLHCGAKGWYDLMIYGGGNNWAVGAYTRPYGEFKTGYVQYLQHSQTPGVAECWALASDSAAGSVCKSMGGVKTRSAACPPSTGSCDVYKLP